MKLPFTAPNHQFSSCISQNSLFIRLRGSVVTNLKQSEKLVRLKVCESSNAFHCLVPLQSIRCSLLTPSSFLVSFAVAHASVRLPCSAAEIFGAYIASTAEIFYSSFPPLKTEPRSETLKLRDAAEANAYHVGLLRVVRSLHFFGWFDDSYRL
jgi:hypothetical protein